MFKIGGVRRDIPNNSIPEIKKMLETLKPKVDLLTGAVMDDPVIHARTKGVGILSKEDIVRYGAVGPTARASGVAIDVRHDDPYAAYPLVNWKVITAEEGDVFAKARVRLGELYESISILEQCLVKLSSEKDGIIETKVKEIPAGMGFGHAEAPRGEVFHFVKSDGSNVPIRHKIRAPSYVNVATYKKSCIGQTISDATITLAAVDPCYCCTERMAYAYDAFSGNQLMNGNDLLRLSQEKTREIMFKMNLIL